MFLIKWLSVTISKKYCYLSIDNVICNEGHYSPNNIPVHMHIEYDMEVRLYPPWKREEDYANYNLTLYHM